MTSIYLDDPDYHLADGDMAGSVYDSMPASPVATSPSGGNGLGSLADELAAAYDSEEEEEYEGEDDTAVANGGAIAANSKGVKTASSGPATGDVTPQAKNGDINGTATPQNGLNNVNNINKTADATVIPPSLQEKLDQVEAEALKGLAMVKGWGNRRRLPEINGYRTTAPTTPEKKSTTMMTNGTTNTSASGTSEEEEDEVKRLMKGLQDLKSQSSIETGSQRLITAHSSLSSHVANQTRNLRDLSSFLSTPLQVLYPVDEYNTENVAEASELLSSLLDLVPQPTPLPLHELNQLHAMTLSLITQLSFLSDSLYMARQQNNVAGRKLRGVKEACREWRNEIDEFERARTFIEEGNWDARLQRREAQGVCKDVMVGFEDFCKGMERRIEGFC